MATIVKRNGKFQVQVRRKGFPISCRTFHLRSDAMEWARHMERKADRGELPTPTKVLSDIKVKDILTRYRDEITIHKRSAHSEGCLINAFLRHPISNLALSQVTSANFNDYREKRLLKVKSGTVNREFSIIKHAFDLAERDWGIPLTTNPLGKLRKLRVQNARSRRLSDAEFDCLMSNVKDSRNPHIKSLIEFAIETGMRRGEVLRVQWKHINYSSRVLLIPITKNGHSRTIPLSPKAMTILDKQQALNLEQPFPLSDNAAKLAWQRLLKRSKICDLHFHDFRHEAISRFFERGLSVAEVALISGHKDVRMLFRYTHLNAENIAKKLQTIPIRDE